MRTVKDVIEEFQGNAVLFHRHGSYLPNPEGDVPEDKNELAAMNYSREWPNENNPLDQNGRTISVEQGKKLSCMGIKLSSIKISAQGRGSETGLYVGLGYLNNSGVMPVINHSDGCDYPVYNLKPAIDAFKKFGDSAPTRWLNNEIPDLINENAQKMVNRINFAVNDTLVHGGIHFFSSHWENLIYVHGRYVARKRLGEISVDWEPTKSAGVLLVKDGNNIIGFEYDTDFNIVE